MKPVFAKIREDGQMNVFAVRVIDLPYFTTEFHFHKECQMVYVEQSEGKRIIGDSIEDFSSDELILLGPDIPHVWHNNSKYFDKKKKGNNARSVALFFHPEKLLAAMEIFGLSKQVVSLMRKCSRGMKFHGATKQALKTLLLEMTTQDQLTQLSTFIQVLEKLSHTREYELLASEGYVNTYQMKDNDRIDIVFKYVFSDFKTDIHLDKAAAMVNMNKQAFCRYFKNRTQKTFVQFVNEVRIGHACKLLAEGPQQISLLAFECGFNSLSNFNRFFREIKNVSPKEYIKLLSA
ncbi:AraC family transcriptional regulator [Chitinophaga solisilvae]|uniref:Helix-turn-helix transcriptional regulator n=1 Tax=Chitinophaga solisilvae TaxID=1233460 RepID=A0A3S1BMB7_9BACT|nr:AraC family transcriptional regulator [Chitinophaga solisilvae]NSL90818.1 helix-turn-helix transcriptional regulator [Chitinophaga solisilvae]